MSYTPSDADDLWTDLAVVREAAVVYGNPAYHHANQATRAFGQTMLDELREIGGPDGLFSEVCALTDLPAKALEGRVPPVELKKVRKSKAPTDDDAKHDAIDPEEAGASESRDIVVPTLLRRALSVHLAQVLTLTSDHLLPKEAIAYRRGRRHVVKRAILDTARAVRAGARYWSKQDVRSFFPSVPWNGIEVALHGLGYSEAFTAIVMALVAVPIERRLAWKSWLPIENYSGAQAGLQESSIIANIFLADLDRLLLRKFEGRLFYRRYSDDLLVMSPTKKVARQAVVAIHEWVNSQGLKLKGVDP